jgi:hypothetical protein
LLVKKAQRITVPLFHVVFDKTVTGRRDLGNGIVLAELDEKESRRVQNYHATVLGYSFDPLSDVLYLRPPSHRIEIFRDLNQEQADIEARVHESVTNALSLLAIASRAAPSWYSEPVDEWNDDRGRWERSAVPEGQGGTRCQTRAAKPEVKRYLPASVNQAWYISDQCVEAWGRLIGLWALLPSKSPLMLAAQYFHDAVTQLVSDDWRAFISGSICLECMLGDSAVELSFRISQRAANIARVLELNTEETYLHIRKMYTARSKLVHEGRHPDPEAVVDFLDFLRKLLPVVATLDSLAGGHKNSLAKIDAVAMGNGEIILDLKARSSIWSLPGIQGGWIDSPGERERIARALFPDFFENPES